MKDSGPIFLPIGKVLEDLTVIAIQTLLVCAFLALAVFAGTVVVWG